MRREIFEKIAGSIMPDPVPDTSVSRQSQPENKRGIHTGTTIIAFHYKDGIMLAADRKTSSGYFGIKSLESIKIHQAGRFTGVGFAGMVSDIQHLLEKLRKENESFTRRYGFILTIGGQVNFLRSIIRTHWTYMWPLSVSVIICGRTSSGEFEIYEIEDDGYKDRVEYSAVGSGGTPANDVLFESRKPIKDRLLTFEQALNLSMRAIYKSGVSDNGTGDIRAAYPKVATITHKNNFAFVDDDIVKKEADSVIKLEATKNG